MYDGIIFVHNWPTGMCIYHRFYYTPGSLALFVVLNFNQKKISIFIYDIRLVGCENAIGIMTKLQSSLAKEETWVDGTTEKLSALPTATSAYELDVSTSCQRSYSILFCARNTPNQLHTNKNKHTTEISIEKNPNQKFHQQKKNIFFFHHLRLSVSLFSKDILLYSRRILVIYSSVVNNIITTTKLGVISFQIEKKTHFVLYSFTLCCCCCVANLAPPSHKKRTHPSFYNFLLYFLLFFFLFVVF